MRASRLAMYQPREFLSVGANYGQCTVHERSVLYANTHVRTWEIGKIFLKIFWVSTWLDLPLPLIVFPAHFFFSMLFAWSTQAKRHGSGRIFYLCNPFRGNVQILYRLQFCLHLKNFTVPRVACKEKADPCTFLAVQKFVKGVWVLTRVGTFSVILIIDRSRTPGRLHPLGSFLFTGVAVKELTSPTSLRHRICQKHSHYGV